jgi:T5orf172 domain
MPDHLLVQLETSRATSEPARVISFYDLTPEEDFHYCVHLITGPEPRRCRNTIDKEKDRPTARCLYRKILSSLPGGTSMQALLSDLAEVTLCRRVHRKRAGIEELYSRMVQKWSNDLETNNTAFDNPTVNQLGNETGTCEAHPLPDDAIVSFDHRNAQDNSMVIDDPHPAPYETRDGDEHPLKAAEPEDDSLCGSPTSLVNERVSQEGATDSRLSELRQPDTTNTTISVWQPHLQPRRVTRSGTSSFPEADFLPYCPKLLTLNPTELIHHTNTSLLALLSGRLKPTAKLHGYVYIFTRPDDPSLVKIGFTTCPSGRRVAAWGRSCCYAANMEFDTGLVPNAWLVEKLVHEELKQYRKIEQRCKWKAMCPTKHQEWFALGVQEAKRVVERWAGWIRKYRPWGPDHALTPEWLSLLDKYRVALKGPDRDIQMWERWARMEKPRTVVPVVQRPTPKQELEQHHSQPTSPNPTTGDISPSSTTVQNQKSTPSQQPRPPKLNTQTPQSINTDSPSPPSPSPSQTPSPTTPLRRSTRRTLQTTPETVRAILKSAFTNLDAYIGTSSPLSSSTTKNKKRIKPRVTIRLDRKSMSLAWGEADEGYCTA